MHFFRSYCYFLLFLVLLGSLGMFACKKDTPPSNPSTIDTLTNDTISPNEPHTDALDTVENTVVVTQKMGGVSFESPSKTFPSHYMETIVSDVGANWIAISPFAFSRPGEPEVVYDQSRIWWGETEQGTETIVAYAREHQLKIMIKPQVWMWSSWVGDFDLETEEEWKTWEQTHDDYIMIFAALAEQVNAEVLCVGTEYRIAAVKRPEYWRNLIAKVKAVYSGKVTYASNWDNYHKVTFWDDLDFIGVDSYFPLVEDATPSVSDLKAAWPAIAVPLKQFSQRYQRPILFTEYGYMSIDQSGWRNWENEANQNSKNANMQAQVNCFEAFFETLWDEDWFAGGFIWKWHADPNRGGTSDKDYTPQNKPVRETIKKWYQD